MRRLAAPHAAVLAVALIGLVLSVFDGGFDGSRWLPAAILVLVLAVAVWWDPGAWRELGPSLRVALAGLVALAAWSLLSIVWADARDDALQAGGRALLYALVLAIAAGRRWSPAQLRGVLAIVAGGLTAIAVGTLAVAVVRGAGAESMFVAGRLTAPTGYVNASSALFAIGVAPALALAADRALALPARALAVGAAALLVQVGLLAQSRGTLLALLAVGALLIAVAPHRGAALALVAVVAAATVAAAGPLLDVRDAVGSAQLGDALRSAARAVAIGSAGPALLAALALAALRRAPPRLRAALTARRTGDALAGALAIIAIAGAIAAVGNPVAWAHARWHDFASSGYSQVASSGNRFTGTLGSSRHDAYRVALDALREHPLHGVGADGFQAVYLAHRRTAEAPKYAHGIEFDTAAGLGVTGLVALLAALGGLVVALAGALRRPAGRLLAAGAAGGFAIFALQGMIDWLWQFPALGVLAVLLAGVAARTAEPGRRAVLVRRRAPALGAWRLGLVSLAAALAVLWGGLALAAAAQRAGESQAATAPAAALRSLQRAARLDPLNSDVLLSRAIVARRAGDRIAWREDLERAIERDRSSWFAHLELALALARGDRRRALAEALRARRLNPGQPVSAQVVRTLRAGRIPDPDAVERALARRQRAIVAPRS